MADESTTDVHSTKGGKRERKPLGVPAAATIAATLTALLGGGGVALVRSKDVDRIETRIDRLEIADQARASAIIQLQTNAGNQAETLGEIKQGIRDLGAKIDALRDRERGGVMR